MKRKLLALELLQCIVDNAGSNLKKNERFINNAIKKYLSISLLLNGVSAHLQIFKVSLNIFKGLIKNFQEYLKNEIGVFFSKILLRMLSSTNSSIEHKKQVIKWLLHISKEGQILVDIFLNYDCHLESVDVFESIVNHLSAISKLPIHNTTSSLTGYPPSPVIQLEYSIRLLALQSLVTIMQSLVQWSNELTDDPNQHVPGNVNNSNGNINLPPTTSTGNAAINLEDPPNSDAAPSHNVNNVRTTDDQLTKQKQLKQQIEHGKKLFNYKPKKGIDYLIKIGHIPHTSKDVAKFLKTTEGLPVAKIGEYIGEIGNPFCKSVLYDYIDLQRFDNLPIYQAVRNFLYNFRLPGESEKIDVIMEKFAERYYNDNKHNFQLHREDSGESNEFIFANADAVYIFSFHLIMLATDLHSRAIKKEKKYSLHDWVKNNAGLNDGKDYPEKFLVSVYESIASTPLKTREDNDVAPNPTNNDLLNGKQRQILFNRESKLMLEKSQELILDKLEKKSIFFTSKNIDHVKPMFELCWCPMLAAFSMNLEISQDADEEIYSLCLSGFQAAIRVSSIFYLETERNAFVTSLSQFTLLSNFREMKKKNIEAIKCLIKIAHDNGNYLGDSWMQVLHCISQLAKIAGIGGPSSNFFPNPAPMPHSVSSDHHQTTPVSFTSSNNSNHSHAPSSHHHHPTASRQTSVSKEIENSNAISVNFHIDLSAIDKIFANTVHLNDNAIVEFVTCLCAVSDTEVNHPEPRPFSLQKLIEIAYYNMERIRFVWSRIWGIMATHFKKVACHASLQIAMYAVDSLRQLAMKFLEKDELANYHFQKDFLKPFEHIIHFNRNLTIRELVIHCLSQMILARSENIKSGWKSIFMVFTLVGNESDESIVFLAFDMLSKILEKYFHLISFTFFVECVNCLVAFSKNIHFKETSIKAIKLLGNCADQLASGNVLPLEDILVTSDNSSMIIFTDNENHLRYWFPILTGLSEVISHPHIDVRTHALDTLFNILKKYGTLYNADLWELLFRGVLLPIFDNVKHFGEGSLKEDNEWLTSTCLNALTHFIELFSFFFDKIHFLTNDYLALLTNFILQENHHLAIIGSTCFLQFIITNVQKWTKAMWKTICISFYYILTQNRCTELLSIGESKAKLIQKVEGAERFSFSEISPAELEKLVAFPVFTKTESEQTATPTPVEEATVSDPPTGSESPPTADPIEQKLVRATPGKYRPFDVNVITGKINVQLQLLSALSEITTNYLSLLENDHLLIIFKSLETTYTFALETNNKIQVWQATGKSGIFFFLVSSFFICEGRLILVVREPGIMPLIIKQENLSMAIHLQILFKLYGSENEDKVNLVENRLIYWVSHLIKDYLRVEDAFAEYPKLYISAKLPIILRALQGFSQIEDQQVCFYCVYIFLAIIFDY